MLDQGVPAMEANIALITWRGLKGKYLLGTDTVHPLRTVHRRETS